MEQLICISTDLLFSKIEYFQGFNTDIDEFINLIADEANLIIVPREDAELDPNYKQLIPYCIMQYDDKIFVYERSKKGGEDRLHNLMSCGVGGHMNVEDLDSDKSFWNALQRELREEVALPEKSKMKIVGLVNDDSNDVGQVHIGVVILFTLQSPSILVKDESLSKGTFKRLDDCKNVINNFENWSQIVINELF